MNCMIGARTMCTFTIDNPLGEVANMTGAVSNPRNFSLSPADLSVPPYASTIVRLYYTPSSINIQEEAEITYSHSRLGKYFYRASGKGNPPGTMDEQIVRSFVSEVSSHTIR